MTSLGSEPPVLSSIPYRTDVVMKSRALVTAMFMPMSFVAGFFGMRR